MGESAKSKMNYDITKDSRYIIIKKPKDRCRTYQTIEQDIRVLSAEILRLIKLPYMTEMKRNQIIYLDQLLAAYEQDQKKYE